MKDRQFAFVLGALALIVLMVGILLYIGSDRGQKEKPAPERAPTAKVPKAPVVSVTEEIPEPEKPEQVEPIIEAPIPAPIASGKCKTDSRKSAKKRGQAAPEGMVYVPGGAFVMGSAPNVGHDDESPAREVCLNGFYIDKNEVTNAQFKQFVDATGYVTDLEKDPSFALGRSWRRPHGSELTAESIPDHPVVCVSWSDASIYARWAGKRLPTEAEWEKAARGTKAQVYPWGNTAPTGELSNIADKSAGLKWSDSSLDDNYQHTAPVGSFPSGKSDYGAFDMAGNVWEWCLDWWGSDYYADRAKTAYRMYFRPHGASADIGFRCVRDAG
jgi:formylglycine-generating enzyme required for sulfatase activity